MTARYSPAFYPAALIFFILFLCGASAEVRVQALSAPAGAFRVIAEFPHDPAAFTQGLVFHGGYLYESTGLNGASSLRQVELKSGKVLKIVRLAPRYFGEGIAILRGRIFQLTWRSKTGFVYDLKSFRQVDAFSYDTEGWGLTTDGSSLIMSDGTDTLRYLKPGTFETVKVLKVKDGGRPVYLLNELEFVKGEIFANVLGSDFIACISPETGSVKRWIDLRQLRSRFNSKTAEVLNGIAYDSKSGRLFVTGKNWPVLFEIRVSGTN